MRGILRQFKKLFKFQTKITKSWHQSFKKNFSTKISTFLLYFLFLKKKKISFKARQQRIDVLSSAELGSLMNWSSDDQMRRLKKQRNHFMDSLNLSTDERNLSQTAIWRNLKVWFQQLSLKPELRRIKQAQSPVQQTVKLISRKRFWQSQGERHPALAQLSLTQTRKKLKRRRQNYLWRKTFENNCFCRVVKRQSQL